MIIDGKHYVTEKEIASRYERSVQWVRKIRYDCKDFPHYELNGRILFNQEEVDNWFKNNLKPR
jgi:hypothetical protein